MKISKLLQASVAAAVLCAASAHATVIDFDKATVKSQLPLLVGHSYTEEGYTFTSSSLSLLGIEVPSVTSGTYSLGETWLGTTTLTSATSSLFQISSLSLLRELPAFINTTVTFVGTKADSTTVSQSFTFKNNKWNTLTFASTFTDLTSLKWTQGSSLFVVDNLNLSAVTAVPEPETYAMLLAGLGLVGFARRRKQA